MDGSMTRYGARLAAAFAAVALLAALSAGSASAGVGQKCPGTFRVLHNDKIDNLSVPAGRYKVTDKRMSCQSASDYFKQFLAADQNKLPKGWKLIKAKQKFQRKNADYSFRISKVG